TGDVRVLERALWRALPDAKPAFQDIRVVGRVVAGRVWDAEHSALRIVLDQAPFQEFLEGFGNPFETLSQHFRKGSDACGHEAGDVAGLWPCQDEQPEEFGVVGQFDELVIVPDPRIHLSVKRCAQNALPPVSRHQPSTSSRKSSKRMVTVGGCRSCLQIAMGQRPGLAFFSACSRAWTMGGLAPTLHSTWKQGTMTS